MSEEKKKSSLKINLEKSKSAIESIKYVNLEKKAMEVNKPPQALLDKIQAKPKKD